MPRHPDPRLRLRRISHGYDLPPKGTVMASGRRFDARCTCGLPWCTWTPRKQRRAERDYRDRRGTWQTADGRFTLTWASTEPRSTGRNPGGGLRMWDAVLYVESGHESMHDARARMLERYERAAAGAGSGGQAGTDGQKQNDDHDDGSSPTTKR